MGVFYSGVVNDNRPSASEYDCAVEALVSAPSRMDATIELRRRGFTGVEKHRLKEVRDGALVEGDLVPAVAPGEVWTRSALDEGSWAKR